MGGNGETTVLRDDDVRLLTEVGYLAAGRGRSEALTIMDGIKMLRPARNAAYIGIALTHMNAGHPDEAARILLEEALPAVTPQEADLVRAFRALALYLDGRPRECREELERIPADSADATAARMAESLKQSL